jgi:outer membrane protein TolC
MVSLRKRPRCLAPALAGLAAAAGLAGCATRPAPSLDATADETLAGADIARMVAPAAALRHPVLKPVTLDPTMPLTSDAVAVIAVLANPELKAARARAKTADAQVLTAGLLPDPTVGASTDLRLSGPDPGNGWAAQIGYELTAIRDRDLAVKGAKALQRQVRLDLAWQEWAVAEQVRLLAGRVLAVDGLSVLAERTRRETDGALAHAVEAAARGDLKADEVNVRRLAALDATERSTQTARDRDQARSDLNALLGLRPDTKLRLAPAAHTPQTLDATALFATARTQRLDLRALRAGYDSQNALVRKAVRDAFPSLAVSLNQATDTANNRTLGPGLSLTLPLWNRNRGPIAEVRATRDALRADYAARLFQTRSDIAVLVEALARTEAQRAMVLQQVTRLLESSGAADAAASRGDLSLTAAEAVRQSARDKLAALITLDQSLLELTVGLELATGASLPATSSVATP